MSFFFERNAELYVSNVTSGWNAGNTDKIPLKQGFSYSIDPVVSSILRENLKGNQSRAPTYFSEKEPLVKFEFSTYINPTDDFSCSERYLWQALCDTTGFNAGSPNLEIDFTNTNTVSSREITLWVAFNNGNIYRLDNCVVESASIEGDIKDIGAISWAGTSRSIVNLGLTSSNRPLHTIQNFDNCIINKFSTTSLTYGSTYNLPLIDFNIDIRNNVNYVYRTILGDVSKITGHYTTGREITGDISAYLRIGDVSSIFDKLNTDKLFFENNTADLTVNLGHSSNTHIRLLMPNVVLEIPEQEFTDLVTLRIPFKATESTIGAADELTIQYYA
jgi:hypothetical protein